MSDATETTAQTYEHNNTTQQRQSVAVFPDTRGAGVSGYHTELQQRYSKQQKHQQYQVGHNTCNGSSSETARKDMPLQIANNQASHDLCLHIYLIRLLGPRQLQPLFYFVDCCVDSWARILASRSRTAVSGVAAAALSRKVMSVYGRVRI